MSNANKTETTQFETNLRTMLFSIHASHTKRIAKVLAPNASAERGTHVAALTAGTPCSCRVCYWAKGR